MWGYLLHDKMGLQLGGRAGAGASFSAASGRSSNSSNGKGGDSGDCRDKRLLLTEAPMNPRENR